MREMLRKKKNNKGFSLVELIVVIAIMAILVGLLAPQFIKYLERTRISKDQNAVAEVERAISVALAEEKIYDEISKCSANPTITFSSGVPAKAGFPTNSLLLERVNEVIDLDTKTLMSSKKYKDATAGPIITIDKAKMEVSTNYK